VRLAGATSAEQQAATMVQPGSLQVFDWTILKYQRATGVDRMIAPPQGAAPAAAAAGAAGPGAVGEATTSRAVAGDGVLRAHESGADGDGAQRRSSRCAIQGCPGRPSLSPALVKPWSCFNSLAKEIIAIASAFFQFCLGMAFQGVRV